MAVLLIPHKQFSGQLFDEAFHFQTQQRDRNRGTRQAGFANDVVNGQFLAVECAKNFLFVIAQFERRQDAALEETKDVIPMRRPYRKSA